MWSLTSPTKAEPVLAIDATDIRDSSKRTADSAGLNESGRVHRLKKARRADAIVIDTTDDVDDNSSDLEFVGIRWQPKPVFRRPPFPRKYHQNKKTISSGRSSKVGNAQDDPLVVEDDDEKTGESSASTRATSVDSEIGTVLLQSSHPRGLSKAQGCLSPPTTEPTPSPFDHPISSNAVISRDRVRHATLGGDRGIAVTGYPSYAITVPLSLAERPQD
ncbi:hypothetical protein OEA41_001270 [Lepraria neglecta]|uniref:Uncharacterized protein n=1 Tax=Lepraria neglecta TaxID=209136 RepID=A0AAD9ZAG3_9LECA|nr:hypothetical protein OEA41_001270 [Lepraria neglecta]